MADRRTLYIGEYENLQKSILKLTKDHIRTYKRAYNNSQMRVQLLSTIQTNTPVTWFLSQGILHFC